MQLSHIRFDNHYPSIIFRVRGLLGSTMRLVFCVGILMAYIFGAVLPYSFVPWASISFSVVFLYGFWYVPDTPLHLLKIGNYDVGWRKQHSNCFSFIVAFSGSRVFIEILSRWWYWWVARNQDWAATYAEISRIRFVVEQTVIERLDGKTFTQSFCL